MAAPPPKATEEEVALPVAVIDKYKSAAIVAAAAIKEVISKAIDGAKVLDLCQAGDKKVEDESEKVYNNKKAVKGVSKGELAFVHHLLLFLELWCKIKIARN